MQYNAMQYNAMQCNAMQCNTINTMQCNTIQCNAILLIQYNAIQYNAMQCKLYQLPLTTTIRSHECILSINLRNVRHSFTKNINGHVVTIFILKLCSFLTSSLYLSNAITCRLVVINNQ